MSDEITTEGLTVPESQATKVIELVGQGKTPKEAAKEVGITLTQLKKVGVLTAAVKNLLDRIDRATVENKKARELIARARLMELMMQDEDPKIALGAAKAQLHEGVGVAVQINNNLVTDPEVVESLKTLEIDVEKSE